eukprot:TRINITY_DN7065_c0_g2_i1.p1 TRINITY_DN7065_c0_g2~~TRINITY_DN7065_c0_g2_i1.p1  ORF type:complete len:419 (+),score=92.33 TRINITY_DN7065_c0_g2_i1:52-1308(+)
MAFSQSLILPPLAPTLPLSDAIDVLRVRTQLKESSSCPALAKPGCSLENDVCIAEGKVYPQWELTPRIEFKSCEKFQLPAPQRLGSLASRKAAKREAELQQTALPRKAFLRKATSGTQLPRLTSAAKRERARKRMSQSTPLVPLKGGEDMLSGSRPSSKEGQQVSRQAAAAFWGMPLPPEEEPAPQVEDDPANLESVAGRKAFPLNELHRSTSVPFDDVKEACRIFKRFADMNEVDVMQSRLLMSHFEQVLCFLCCVKDASGLDADFVAEAFKCADRDGGGEIDIWEFVIWYSSFSFSEAICVSQTSQDIRKLARMFQVSVADLDRYKQCFDRYDKDSSGLIDLEEFQSLLTDLLKVPSNAELPQERVMKMWRAADIDGNGSVDFAEFVRFYMQFFDDRDGKAFDPFSDYYKGFRKMQ